MGKINSRKKGKRGEKKARLVLEEWTGLEFAGVPASGGLRWGKAENISGDVVCTDAIHRFDFSIEVKNYKEINFEHLIMPQVSSVILKEFWPQCISDANRAKKLPLLMMRYDGISPSTFFFVGMMYKDFKLLKPVLNRKYPYFKLGRLILMASPMLFETDYKKVKKLTHKIISKQWR